jgi:hypothetical protein
MSRANSVHLRQHLQPSHLVTRAVGPLELSSSPRLYQQLQCQILQLVRGLSRRQPLLQHLVRLELKLKMFLIIILFHQAQMMAVLRPTLDVPQAKSVGWLGPLHQRVIRWVRQSPVVVEGLSVFGRLQWGSCDLYSHYKMGTSLDSIKPSGQATYGYSTMTPDNNPLNVAALADMYSCQPTSSRTCYTIPGTPHTCFNHPPNPYYALNSGYDAGEVNACGCHDWNNQATTPRAAQTSQNTNCQSTNSMWDDKVYQRILWLKKACPTAYSYQFDDESTQLTCNVSGQMTSYQLTFCPGGATGVT